MKTLLVTTLLTVSFVCDASDANETGLLTSLVTEKQDGLSLAKPLSKAGALLGLTVVAASQYPQKQITRGGIQSAGASLALVACGAALMGFAVYHFIGKEMQLIMDSQNTLKQLEGSIATWQNLLPELQHNQEDTAKKLAGALKVLETITPLIRKLVGQDTALLQDPRIPALQQELESLKTLIVSLGTANSSTDTAQKIQELQKTSFSIFGKKKKCQTCQRPLDLDYNKAILYKE